MKESMPDTHGWIDRGPSRRPPAKNGPVRVTRPDGTRETVPASSPGPTIRQGVNDPRELSPDEQGLVLTNQIRSDEDLAAMEKWYSDGGNVPEANR
jgi:hypothetical protein